MESYYNVRGRSVADDLYWLVLDNIDRLEDFRPEWCSHNVLLYLLLM